MAGRNIELLNRQIETFKPKFVAVAIGRMWAKLIIIAYFMGQRG